MNHRCIETRRSAQQNCPARKNITLSQLYVSVVVVVSVTKNTEGKYTRYCFNRRIYYICYMEI